MIFKLDLILELIGSMLMTDGEERTFEMRYFHASWFKFII